MNSQATSQPEGLSEIQQPERNQYRSPQPRETEVGYRSVCKTAVICFVLAIFSLAAYLSTTLIILPVVGIGFGILAISNLKKYPEELVGRIPARVGLVACVVIGVSSIGFHVYSYMTEVPEGYERINFYLLKPKSSERLPYAKIAEELDGKKVFLKGYVRPNDKKRGLTQFILVGSFGSCCFGGSEDPADVVAVSLLGSQTVNYGFRIRHIGGTFRLVKEKKFIGEQGVPHVYYVIEADYLK